MKNFSITDMREILTIGQEWQDYNFGHVENWKPATGLIEEVGELAHAILKKAQKIRSYSNPANDGTEFALLDAIADAVIYLGQYCAQEGLVFPEKYTIVREDIEFSMQGYTEEYQLLFRALTEAGGLVNPDIYETPSLRQTRVNCILTMLATISHLHGENIEELVVKVWNNTVGPRDWKNYPATGRPPQEEVNGFYTFDMTMGGYGDTAEDAWDNALEGLCNEPGPLPDWTVEPDEE